MALKNHAMTAFVIGGAFLGGAFLGEWLWATGSQRGADERQAVAAQYSLGNQQMAVYDKCVGAMGHRSLRAGGSKQQFCGCLTKSGLGELQPDEADEVLGWIETGLPKPARVTDGQDQALQAAITCSEDTRGTWSSVAAMQSWCAEKDTRRGLPQCRLELK